MTPDDIDKQIALYAEEGGPGLIKLSADTWCKLPVNFGAACTDPKRGIRYRGVRVWVSRAFEDQVLSRDDALALGHDEFEELTSPPSRS